jgi:hypothetical protein
MSHAGSVAQHLGVDTVEWGKYSTSPVVRLFWGECCACPLDVVEFLRPQGMPHTILEG